MNMISSCVITIIIWFAVLRYSCCSFAESAFDAARTVPIDVLGAADERAVEVEVKAASMLPGARCVYSVPSQNRQSRQAVKLFPGKNLVTVKTSSGLHEQIIPFSVSKQNLRIEMRCGFPSYELLVNDHMCGNAGNYFAEDAASGLYEILVFNYWGDEIYPFVPVPTTVSIYVNEELVCKKSNSDGKFMWSVGAVVLHSGDQVGGYDVDGDRLDIVDQGELKGLSVNNNALNSYTSGRFVDYEVTRLCGPNGGNPVFLVVGAAARFSASGTLLQYHSGNDQKVDFIDCFKSSNEAVGSIDRLGVFVAKESGHTHVSCTMSSCNPIEVYISKGVEMAMDGNRDGEIDFDNPGDKSCLFWVNDDCDVSHYKERMWQEDDYGPKDTAHKDWDDEHIGNKGAPGRGTCMRDLEDFTRLHIKVDEYLANMPGITYWLRFESESEEPFVNIFEAVDETDGYLSDKSISASQALKSRIVQVFGGGLDYPVDASKIRSDGGVSCFLLEGCHAGKGKLTFVVKKDGAEISKQSVTLELQDIAWFYDVWQAKVLSGARWTAEVSPTAEHDQTKGYQPETDEKLLFVHGWNMEGWEKRRWTETIFKRLWWQGYKGSVALFDWPTLDGYVPYIWPPSSLADALFELHHFDNSEYRAWRSAEALAGVIGSLNADGQLCVLAHSMGNVATAEALRKYSGPTIKTYIAAQAALSAQFYDGSVVSRDPSRQLNGADTPDIMGHFASGDTDTTAYLTGVLANRVSVGKVFNYYNNEDYALGIWEYNNNYKPDNWTPYLFSYMGNKTHYQEGNDHFFRGQVDDMFEVLSVADEVQRHRIFAYIAESRSLALGQARGGVSGFVGWDLKANVGYNSRHYSHSQEFRSNVAAESKFWKQVIANCGFTGEP